MAAVLHLQAGEPRAEGVGDVPEDTSWPLAEQEPFQKGTPGLTTTSLQLKPLCRGPLVWGNLACGARVPNHPSHPPLSQQVSHSRQWLISE